MTKKLIIMNSAMMPSEGIYEKENLSIDRVKKLLEEFGDNVDSYVGYQNVQDMLKENFQLKINLNRNVVKFSEETTILAIQLNYRILSPKEKSLNLHGTKLEDYTFSMIKYYPRKDFYICLQPL